MSAALRSMMMLSLLLVALVALLVGCQKDCSDEYDRGYRIGKTAGMEEGRDRGRDEGYEKGFGSRPSSVDSRVAVWIFDIVSRLGAVAIVLGFSGLLFGILSEYDSDAQRVVVGGLGIFSVAVAIFVFLTSGVYTAVGKYLEHPPHDGPGKMLGFAALAGILWAVPVLFSLALAWLAAQPGVIRVVPGLTIGLLAILWPLIDLAIHAPLGTLYLGSEILAGAIAVLAIGVPVFYVASESDE